MSASLHNPHPQKLSEKLKKVPTPGHLYSSELLAVDSGTLARAFKQNLSKAQLHFSVKTCPLPRLIRDLAKLDWGFEVVSEADLLLVEKAKARKRSVLASPLFPDPELLYRLLGSPLVKAIHLESPEAVWLTANLLQKHRRLLKNAPLIGLRIHSAGHFGFAPDAGALSPSIQTLLQTGARVSSLQIHSSSEGGAITAERCRGWFAQHLKNLSTAKALIEKMQSAPVTHLDLGGGLEHPLVWRVPVDAIGTYHSGKIPAAALAPRPSLTEVSESSAKGIAEALSAHALEKLDVSFEFGRVVSTRALSTLLTVGSVKPDLYPDAKIVITDGNTSILGPIHRVILPFEHFSVHQPASTAENCFVYGNLPHSSDWLLQNVLLHGPAAGDRILLRGTGAYFLSQEAQFGHPRPGVYCESTGRVIRKPETIKQIFQRDGI